MWWSKLVFIRWVIRNLWRAVCMCGTNNLCSQRFVVVWLSCKIKLAIKMKRHIDVLRWVSIKLHESTLFTFHILDIPFPEHRIEANSEWLGITYHGCHVIGLYCDGNTLEHSRSCGCMHWKQGNLTFSPLELRQSQTRSFHFEIAIRQREGIFSFQFCDW